MKITEKGIVVEMNSMFKVIEVNYSKESDRYMDFLVVIYPYYNKSTNYWLNTTATIKINQRNLDESLKSFEEIQEELFIKCENLIPQIIIQDEETVHFHMIQDSFKKVNECSSI